jgi:hypothetical protein
MPDAGESIANSAPLVPAVFRAQWPWLNFGELQFATNLHRLLWNGFPIVVPYINPAADAGFVVAGIFPVVNSQPPAPAELYSQVLGRTNLAYYHWEVTQPRIGDWHAMNLVQGMLAGLKPPKVEAPAYRWLQDTNALRHLGNTVTEITRVSPRELSLVRTSAAGFTAWELTQLARWLEGDQFPHWTPPQPAAGKRSPATPATPKPAS